MADLSPAEIMVNSLVPAQRLIRRLQAVQKAIEPPKGISIFNDTKARIAAFQGNLQRSIDELTAQRERAVALIYRISDPDAMVVILHRYGLIGPSCEKVPYSKIGEKCTIQIKPFFHTARKALIS